MRLVCLHALDAALVAGSAQLAAWMVGTPNIVGAYLPMVVAVFLLSLNATSAYGAGDGRRDQRRLLSAALLAVLLLACLAAVPPFIPFGASLIVAVGVCVYAALAAGRKGVDVLVRQAYMRGIGLRRAVLIGSLDEVGTALREIRSSHSIDQYVVGHLSPVPGQDPSALGSIEELDALLDQTEVQEVLVATTLPRADLLRVAQVCFERGTALFVIPAVRGNSDFSAEPLRMGNCLMVRLHPARLEMPSLLMKRIFDVSAALLALLVLAPLLAVIALAIRIESNGPVFYRSRRVGLGGKHFGMWKFRSMVPDAESRETELAHLNIYGNGTFKLRDDPRVTRTGKVLRRTSLDELPQLFNVLVGEMSIVGPRPALVNDLGRYKSHHFERLSVVPGITGPWQVNGRNLITDFETVVSLERDYIASWSLMLDAKIIVRTVGVVIRGEGAY